MAVRTETIAERRHAERNGQSIEGRVALALEQIADALEAVRGQLVDIETAIKFKK